MFESKPSRAEIDGKASAVHLKKLSHHSHRKTTRTSIQSTEANPLIGYLEQEKRKLLTPVHGDKAVAKGKLAEGIKLLAENDYENRMQIQASREMDHAKIRAGEKDILLTDAFNRGKFVETIQNVIARNERNPDKSTPTSLLFEDLDRFKIINDSFGHPFGDLLLKLASRANARSLHRRTDVHARYGGEELTDLLDDTDLLGAITVAMRIQENYQLTLADANHREGIEDLIPDGFKFPEGFNPYQTISFGLAALEPGHTAKDFIEAGDKAMYKAKEVRHMEQDLGIKGEGSTGKIAINTGEKIYVINTDVKLVSAQLQKLDLTDDTGLESWLSIAVGQSTAGFKDAQAYISSLQKKESAMRNAVKFMLKSNTQPDVIKRELAVYLKIPLSA
jgi:diguanylate cyclase (GGDEF)-like protein